MLGCGSHQSYSATLGSPGEFTRAPTCLLHQSWNFSERGTPPTAPKLEYFEFKLLWGCSQMGILRSESEVELARSGWEWLGPRAEELRVLGWTFLGASQSGRK